MLIAPSAGRAPPWCAARCGCRAKAWLHVQDFEVDAAFSLGLLRGAGLKRLVFGLERWLMRRFDVVSTISHRMHQRLLDKGVAPAKATVAPNWVDIEAISPSAFAALAPVWGEAPVVNHFRALLGMTDIHLLPELGSVPVSALPEPCGVVVPPEQPMLFSEALLQLAQDPESRYQMGESARHYAETHLHVDAVLGRFVAWLEQELLLK